MIDFRYHLVSIVAIFLALAIGIVLGTTALNGPVTAGLQRSLNSLTADANSLRSQNASLRQQMDAAGRFAEGAAPRLVAHLLNGQRVVLVEAPGAPDQVEHGVINVLRQAGAAISGQVTLQDKFFDTGASTLSYLDQLSQGVKPGDVTLSGSTPQQRAAQVLASAIVSKGLPGLLDSTSQAVLSGFAGGGFLTTSGKPAARATLAVVITSADPFSGPNADPANKALTALAAAVGSASMATVMAGPASSAQQGGAIAALRSSSSNSLVSSVDDADLAFGQVAVAQALAAQMKTHTAGSYGAGPGATEVAPSPMPSASPTATAPTPASAKQVNRREPR